MGIALVLIWLFFTVATDNFLSARNLSILSIEMAVTATLALGMLLVLLPGQILAWGLIMAKTGQVDTISRKASW